MLLLCGTSIYRIIRDKNIPYYSEVEKWSNIYAYHIGIGGYYGHGFKLVKLPENYSMMDELYEMVSGVEPVAQFIAACGWVMTEMIKFHRV